MSKLTEILKQLHPPEFPEENLALIEYEIRALMLELTDEPYELAYAMGNERMYSALVELRKKVKEL